MKSTGVRLEPSWLASLESEFSQPYMLDLKQFLLNRKRQGCVVYPSGSEYFAALDRTPIDRVKVVILGQDPYHGPGQAHGLCFSVPAGVRPPPSLVNIFKELEADLSIPVPGHGSLLEWADRGVLLLNSVLTVEQGRAGSHQGRGWESFTDRVIRVLNDRDDGVVFMLLGAYAQRKGAFIDD